MDKFCYAFFWKGCNGIPSKRNYAYLPREQSIILQIHKQENMTKSL